MRTLIKLVDGRFEAAPDRFQPLAEDAPLPEGGAVLVGLERFRRDGALLLEDRFRLGVRVEPDHRIEDLAYDLHRIELLALAFPKFRDGRPYSAATLLRRRYGFKGEIRAVGDVLREQAFEMVRCGFDAFEPADGSDAQAFGRAAGRFRHVYQAAVDGRAPAFLLRLDRLGV